MDFFESNKITLFRMICHQTDIPLVQNVSEKCNYNPNLDRFNNPQKFLLFFAQLFFFFVQLWVNHCHSDRKNYSYLAYSCLRDCSVSQHHGASVKPLKNHVTIWFEEFKGPSIAWVWFFFSDDEFFFQSRMTPPLMVLAQKNKFMNVVILKQISIVITLFHLIWNQMEFYLVLNHSEKCNNNPPLAWLNEVQHRVRTHTENILESY